MRISAAPLLIARSQSCLARFACSRLASSDRRRRPSASPAAESLPVDRKKPATCHCWLAYAAQPQLGTDHGDYVTLDRPPTRFLVPTDAENRYETRRDRHNQRKLLLDSITKDIPKDLRPNLYHRASQFVEIVTWGRLPFEFAHFTDCQLADALLQTATVSHPSGRTALVHAINMQRTHDPSPNITDAWRQSGVSKVHLADAVWPLLRRRVEAAIKRGNQGRPIMSAILRGYQLAGLSHQQTTVLARRQRRCR